MTANDKLTIEMQVDIASLNSLAIKIGKQQQESIKSSKQAKEKNRLEKELLESIKQLKRLRQKVSDSIEAVILKESERQASREKQAATDAAVTEILESTGIKGFITKKDRTVDVVPLDEGEPNVVPFRPGQNT